MKRKIRICGNIVADTNATVVNHSSRQAIIHSSHDFCLSITDQVESKCPIDDN